MTSDDHLEDGPETGDAARILEHIGTLDELNDDEFALVRDAVLDEIRRRTGVEHLTTNERLDARYGPEDSDEWRAESSREAGRDDKR